MLPLDSDPMKVDVSVKSNHKRSAVQVAATLCIAGIVVFFSTNLVSLASTTVVDWKVDMAEGDRRLESQDLDGAEACFRHALKDFKKDKSSSKDEIAGVMLALAQVLHRKGMIEEVLPLFKKAIHLLEKAHGKESAAIVPALILLADTFESEGDFKKAIKVYVRALAITEKTSGSASLTFADYQHRLGLATFENGQPRQAEDLYRSSLSIIMSQPDLPSTSLLELVLADYIDLFMKSPDVRKTLTSQFQRELLKDDLGDLQRTKGVAASSWNKEVAARLANQANTQAQKNGSSDPSSPIGSPYNSQSTGNPPSWSTSSTAFLKITSSDPAALEALNQQRIDFYERMIEIDVKTLGPDHPSVARDLYGLASIYLSSNKYDSAKPLLIRALSIYERAYDQNALLVKRTKNLLNLIDQEQSPPVEDSSPLGYLAGLPRVPLAAQTLGIALRMSYLAFLAYSFGRVGDAAKFYAWSVANTAASCGEESLLTASCLTDYGRVLRSAGKQSEAELMESSAQRIIRKSLSKQAALARP